MKLPESTATIRSAGQHVVKRDRQRARIDPLAVALVVVRHVAPADLGGDPVAQRGRPVAAGVAPPAPPPQQRPARRARAVTATSPVTPELHRPVRADGARLVVDLDHGRVRADQRAVPQRPHVQRAAPADDQVGAAISSAASGEAKPPLTSRSHGLPRNRPLAAAEVASSAPHRSASRSRSGPAAGDPRAPAGDEHRPPARASASASDGRLPVRRRAARAGGGAERARRRASVALARLHVQRQGQHHRAPLVAPRCGRPGPCRRPRSRASAAGTRWRRPPVASAATSMRKLDRTAALPRRRPAPPAASGSWPPR